MSTLVQRFWRWYERNYLLNLSVATGLFLFQAFHLYWLFTDVVLQRLLGRSFFIFPQELWPIYVFIDYTEIPALITTSAVYLHSLGKRNTAQAWLALFALNIQWLHLFWITDEVVVQNLSGNALVGLPAWLAWIAILIDYLEVPVMVDTVRRLVNEIRDLRIGGQAQLWRTHWQEEGDAAYVYRQLARDEDDRERARLYRQLAEIEDQHVERWGKILRRSGVLLGPHRPSLRVRLLSAAGRLIGWQLPATLLLAEERREMEGYLRAAGKYTLPDAVEAAQTLAKEAAEHAQQLSELLGIAPEPWHRTDVLRTAETTVHSFTLGLTMGLGLLTGLAGAAVPSGFLLAAGVAGAVAIAGALAATSYMTSKGEHDRLAHELAMEREELRLMPDLEEKELALVYRTRGMDAEEARRAARSVMEDPERALAEKLQHELGGVAPPASTVQSAWTSGLGALAGAIVPALPYFNGGTQALWVSIGLVGFGCVVAGVARGVISGRSALRSVVEMVLMTAATGLLAYLAGRLIT